MEGFAISQLDAIIEANDGEGGDPYILEAARQRRAHLLVDKAVDGAAQLDAAIAAEAERQREVDAANERRLARLRDQAEKFNGRLIEGTGDRGIGALRRD